ncbi:MAG: serine/threonine dehydratase [Kineosporiaceae bacterium]
MTAAPGDLDPGGRTRTATALDISAARDRIAGHVRRTPVLAVDVDTPAGHRPVVLKLECLQVTGSFKPRGAVNSLLTSGAGAVVACSGGNHGLAVAWAARRLGRRAVVVVPASAAVTKVAAMHRLGAEVVQHGDVPAAAFERAADIVSERGWPMVHPYDQPATVEGQGTLGLELIEDAPDVTHWLVAVGGGGLPAGVALAVEGWAQVVAVEPVGCPSLYEAQRSGRPVLTRAEGIARTSLGPPSLGALPWTVLADRVGPCRLVTDDDIAAGQEWLWREVRVVAEPGGATALAALRSGAWAPPPGARVGVVVCGGNADELPR